MDKQGEIVKRNTRIQSTLIIVCGHKSIKVLYQKGMPWPKTRIGGKMVFCYHKSRLNSDCYYIKRHDIALPRTGWSK